MAIIVGTSHFTSLQAAISYYRPYGYCKADVERKLQQGEISIGAPADGKVEYIREGRYFVSQQS